MPKFVEFFKIWVLLMVEWILNVYKSKGFWTLYNRVKSFFIWLNNYGDIWIFNFQKWAKFEEFAKNLRVLKCRPPNICLWKWSLVSMCSSLRARLNALRRFSHTRFVEEISTKYCWKWILLRSLMYILLLSINWYIIGILGGRNSMPKVYQPAC